MNNSFRSLDHTGDLGVEVWGSSWEELFQNASLATVYFIADLTKIRPDRKVSWQLKAEGLEGLLVRHLEEILYRMDAQGMVFSCFEVRLEGGCALRCEAWGEPLDREQHGFKTELKAVTYHGLKLWQESGICHARIIFDV